MPELRASPYRTALLSVAVSCSEEWAPHALTRGSPSGRGVACVLALAGVDGRSLALGRTGAAGRMWGGGFRGSCRVLQGLAGRAEGPVRLPAPASADIVRPAKSVPC